MNRIFIISALLVLASCSSTRKIQSNKVSGTYIWIGFYGHSQSMELKEDQSFEYKWKFHMFSGTTVGTWKNEGDTIIFNSNIQKEDIPGKSYELIRTEFTESDSVKVKVLGSKDEVLPFVNCVLTKNTSVIRGTVTDLDGEARLPKSQADSIHLSFVGYRAVDHPIDKDVSTYVFKMQEGDDAYRFFKNEKWILRNAKLYDPDFETPMEMKNYYERIK